MRNNSKSAMLRIPSLFESINSLLHLWTSLLGKRIQPTSSPIAIGRFSFENYVIKKGRPRGARHGKTEAQKEHFIAHNARRRCIKHFFEGIHDRFQKDVTYRDSQLKIGWTEEKCIEMDKLAQENFHLSPIT